MKFTKFAAVMLSCAVILTSCAVGNEPEKDKNEQLKRKIENYIKNGEIGFTSELSEFIDYIHKNDLKPLESEFIVFNDVVAGTVDLFGEYCGATAVLADYKTTATLHKEALRWQLSLYEYLMGVSVDIFQAFHFTDKGLKVVDVEPIPFEEILKLIECERNGVIYAGRQLVVADGLFDKIIEAGLAAARMGKKTVLFEKQYILGGLATAGLITIYLPICDGEGNQVSFGIAEELFRLSIKHGYQDMYPKAWLEDGELEEKIKNRYMVQYNPHIFEQLVEELLLDEGVEILYGTSICKTEVSNDKITHVVVENKSGRCAIEVKSVVDATGDADICYISGEDTEMNPRKNPLAAWYYYADNDGVHLVQHGYADVPNCSDEKANEALVQTRFDGVTAEELTKIMVLSRKHSISHMLEKKKKNKE